MQKLGLDGFTVIDFTTKEAGPICSEYLGLVGMNVVRVDHPSAKNMSKNDQYYFVADNLNKKCVTIDYETKEGQKLLFDLLSKADVLVENRPFGFMEQIGCGYDDIKKVNDKIIYCAIKPYTKDSPWANAAWNPTTVDAMGGSTYLTGYVGGIPVEPGPQLSDLSTCGYAATGILAALYQREETGKGQYIEASMQDAIVAHARSAYEKYSLNGIVTRVGNNFPTLPDMVPMSLFHTKGEGPEDWAMIGCMGDPMVQTLCETMGKPELYTDPRFDTFEHRLENKDEMLKIINYSKEIYYDHVVAMDVVDPNEDKGCDVLTATEEGIGKRTTFEAYSPQTRGGKGNINVKITERTGAVIGLKVIHKKQEIIIVNKLCR